MTNNDGVSVVICCYNSSSRIVATLEHLQKIDSKGIPWEVVLVDNLSDDDTVGVALNTWNKNPVTHLKFTTEGKRGLMNARLKGVSQTIYELISFIDDDNWVEPDWISKVYSILEKDRSLAACGGSSEPVFEKNPPEWFSEYAGLYAVGKQQEKTGYVDPKKGFLWGAGLTIRKKIWNNLFEFGFNNLLKGRSGKALTAGEDSEICYALLLREWKFWYEESLTFKHYIPEGRLNINYVLKAYEGFGKAQVILSLYLGYINKISTNKSSWMLQCLASLKMLGLTGLKYAFSTNKNKIKNKVMWRHDKAYTFELLFNRVRYNEARQQIVQIDYAPKYTEDFVLAY